MNMTWYPHFMADYESDTQHLSLIEHGAYRLLLDYYYKHKKPLPANASILHRVCRAFADDEQAAIQNVLDQFFVLKKDGWHQKRADAEIDKASEISAKRAAAAKVKHSKQKEIGTRITSKNGTKKAAENGSANALQMHTQLTTHNNKEIHSSPKPEIKPRDELFEALAFVCRVDWKICPDEQRGALNQTTKILRKAGRTAEEVRRVGDWWFANDWRGKQGQAPRAEQIREVWAQAFAPMPDRDEHPNAYRPGKMVY